MRDLRETVIGFAAKMAVAVEIETKVQDELNDDAQFESATELFMSTLIRHAKNRSSEVVEAVRKAFSSDRKFADYEVHHIEDFVFTPPTDVTHKEMDADGFRCNP